MNCYTWGRFNVGQCLEQIKKTSIRMVELPAEQTRPGSLIPELMVNAPLGGEWQYSLPDLKELLAKDGFRVDGIAVFGYTGYPGSAAFIKRRIDFAEALGAETLVLGCHHKALSHAAQASGREEAQAQKDARSFIYSMLREVGDYAAGKGIRIALEIHAGVTANAADALRTMKEVNRPNVGINFDTANIIYYSESLDAMGYAESLESLAKHVFHVHLKDIIRGKTPRENVLPRLGTGEVNFRKVFDILHAAGFCGPFCFEVETFHGATASDDISAYHADLAASIEHIRALGEFD
jgi:sugar phosphate isomerase/epimerase